MIRNYFQSGIKQAVIISFLAVLAGCNSVSNSAYLHPELDMAAVRKVAVVTFANYTREPMAGEKVTNMFFTQLLSTGFFDVSEPARTDEIIKKHKNGSGVDSLVMQKMKEALNIQAVFMGSVDEYSFTSSGSKTYPLVTISARLVDCETGTVLWSSTVTGDGSSSVPVLNIGAIKTLPELAQTLCARIVGTIK